ncbi:MAG TPA: hypothetical protein VH165_11530, partial [Kofleriaceae bacterium]|nr:hypothetical protein [Kofleriaceae bacterium]
MKTIFRPRRIGYRARGMSGSRVDSEATHSLTIPVAAQVAPEAPSLSSSSFVAAGRPILPAQLRDPGRYEMLGEHGRGALGRVTRAHDLELGRD